MSRSPLVLTAAFALTLPALTSAGPTPAQKCEATVETLAAKFASCRLLAEAAFTKKADALKLTASLTKCETTFTDKFNTTLTKIGSDCPVTESAEDFKNTLTECTDAVATAAPGGAFPVCGDNAINVAGEHCDGSNLGDASCTTLGFVSGALACSAGCKFDTGACVSDGGGTSQTVLATGQSTCFDAAGAVISCAGTGQDGEFQKGLARSYTDNGDGTITDNRTGLIWEKLSDDGSIHDWDNVYTWADAFGLKLAALNAEDGFAGHTDWRVPNVNELESLVDRGTFGPAINSVFHTGCTGGCTVTTCSCTHSGTTKGYYWSSTTDPFSPGAAWYVDGDGIVLPTGKLGGGPLRAVRGGS